MISTTYAYWHGCKAACRHIYLPVLDAGKFTFFGMMVNVSANSGDAEGECCKKCRHNCLPLRLETRKAGMSPATPAEFAWIQMAVRTVIRQVALTEADPLVAVLTMADLPSMGHVS